MANHKIDQIINKMVEVELPDKEKFLIVKETLSRMGIASKSSNTLSQSCHILHKQGKYYIAHFKLMMELDGKVSNFDEKDQARQNTIASLLESWGLVKIVDKSKLKKFVPIKQIKIVPFSEKEKWNLVAKHRIGRSKNKN